MEALDAGVATVFKAPRAVFEASRCIECRDAPCTEACPAGVDIPGFIAKIKMEDFLGANQLIGEKVSFLAFAEWFALSRSYVSRTAVLQTRMGRSR